MASTAQQPMGTRQRLRIYTPFEPSEVAQIDAWGFSQMIRDRSEAIRALVLEALKAKAKESRSTVARRVR